MICYGPHASDIVGRHLIIVVALGIVPSWIIGDLVYWKKNRYLKLLLSGKTFLRYLNTGLTLLTRYQPFWLPLSLHKHNCNHGQR